MFQLRSVLRWLLKLRGSPKAIAGGLALGTFIAFTPTVGLQVILAVFIATIFNLNRPAAIVPVWVTNPVTIPPIFTFNYWLGAQIYEGPSVNSVYAMFIDIGQQMAKLDFYQIHEQLMAFMHLGREIFIPLILGSIIVGLAAGTCIYFLAKRLLLALATRRARKKISRQHTH